VPAPVRDRPGASAGASGRPRADQEPDLWRAVGVLLDPFVLLAAVRDEDGHIVDLECQDANQAACDYVALEYADMVGRRLLDIAPGHVAVGLLAAYIDVVESGTALVLDDVVYAEQGRGAPRRYDLRAVQFGDGLAMTFRDVTDRIEQEAALAASELRFRLLAENASDVVYLAGPDRLVQWVAPSVTQALGWSNEDLVGTEISDLVHPDDLAPLVPVRDQLYQGIATPDVSEHEVLLRMRTKDGSYRWMSGGARPIAGPAGIPLGVAGGFHDVDDLVKARDDALAARHAQEQTRLSMDAAVIGMALVDPNGRFLHVNPALCRMLGYPRARLEELSVPDVTHPDDIAAGLQGQARLVAGERDSFTQRKRYLTAAGAIIWCDLYAAAVRDDDGRMLRQVAQMVDVTGEVLAIDAAARRPEPPLTRPSTVEN